MLCEKTGAVMKVIPMNEQGELKVSEFLKLLNNKTKIALINITLIIAGNINDQIEKPEALRTLNSLFLLSFM